MKKTLLTFLALFLAFSFAQAENFYYEIKQEFSVSKIETELQTVIDNATNNDIVTVTGSKTNADATLTLHIAAGKTVVWQATYQSGSPFWADHLISFSGAGTFVVENGSLLTANANGIHASGEGSAVIVRENGKVQTSGEGMNAIITYGYVEIKDNAQINSTTGETIASHSDNATVLVTGGTISATSENAIITWGKNSQIHISGGYVSNYAKSDVYHAVYALDAKRGNQTLVHVSGNAIVEAKGMGSAVASYVNVKISGNAQVRNNLSGAYYAGAVMGTYYVEVMDNAKVSATNNCAIFCYENVFVSDCSLIEAKNDAIAIKIYGEVGPTIGEVVVSDHAQVIAANNYAISSHNSVKIYGGMVFSYGNKMSDIINNEYFTSPFSQGFVLAWDKNAGNTNYEKYSTDDIFILPGYFTAYWDIKDGEHGIWHNYGFIPLDVNILSVNDSNLPNIEVYPNPTTGILKVQEFKSSRVQRVEIFDMMGRKIPLRHSECSEESRTLRIVAGRGSEKGWQLQADGVVIDLTLLPAGVYFVRVETEGGVVVKKVIRN